MVVLVSVTFDALLAVLVWLAAFELQGILGRWSTFASSAKGLQTAMVVGIFTVAVWIGLRLLMGLYPGYGLSPAERLRRHTYSVVGTLAAVTFAMALIPIGVMASKFGPLELVGAPPQARRAQTSRS